MGHHDAVSLVRDVLAAAARRDRIRKIKPRGGPLNHHTPTRYPPLVVASLIAVDVSCDDANQLHVVTGASNLYVRLAERGVTLDIKDRVGDRVLHGAGLYVDVEEALSEIFGELAWASSKPPVFLNGIGVVARQQELLVGAISGPAIANHKLVERLLIEKLLNRSVAHDVSL
jgi:hypothetical protein